MHSNDGERPGAGSDHGGGAGSSRDSDRAAVYAAEDQVRRMLALADESDQRRVRFGDSTLVLPAERKFADLQSVQRYVNQISEYGPVRDAFGRIWPVTVRDRAGATRATYVSESGFGGVIAIPATHPDGRWAMCEMVVLHEFAHHVARGPGHGPEFREAYITLCSLVMSPEVGLLLRAAFAGETLGPTSEAAKPATVGDDTFRRIGALLAKAEGTDNEAEAEAYLAKAQQLATRYSVDLALARQHIADRTKAPEPVQVTTTIGEPGKRINKHLVSLYVGIARANDVRVNIAHNSTYVIAFGFDADIEVVNAVFATATAVMVEGANRHVRSKEWEGTTYFAGLGTYDVRVRPVTAAVARSAFYTGFRERLSVRLAQARAAEVERAQREEAARAEAERARGDHAPDATDDDSKAVVSVAIALRQKDKDVEDYYRRTSRAKGSWSGYRGSAGTASGSRDAGRKAADRMRLTPADGVGGKAGEIGG